MKTNPQVNHLNGNVEFAVSNIQDFEKLISDTQETARKLMELLGKLQAFNINITFKVD